MRDIHRATAKANGADLYHEIRGEGPPLLFVHGASGDAGRWAKVVDAFVRDHTVLTYDRRGNSRSGAPEGWRSMSMQEQADDAAALLEALGLRPATVVGSSGGAVVVLSLVERDPEAVRAAVVHEPPLRTLVPEDAKGAPPSPGERDDPRAALEGFLRVALGDEVFDSLDPELRDRMLGNAQVFFEMEREHFEGFAPDTGRLRTCGAPLAVARGRDTRDDPALRFLHQAAAELAERAGAPLRETTGKTSPT